MQWYRGIIARFIRFSRRVLGRAASSENLKAELAKFVPEGYWDEHSREFWAREYRPLAEYLVSQG